MLKHWTKQDPVGRKSPTSGSNKKLPDIRVVMIGCRDPQTMQGSGKSSVGNIILGKNAFVVGRRTAQSVQASANVHGRHVTVVDTPSWWWHYPVEKTPKFDRLEIMRSPTLCPPGPHVFLLVIPVDSFTLVHEIEKHLEYFFENVWSHTLVLFSSVVANDSGILNLKKQPRLQQLFKKCQHRYHVLNIKNRHDNSQVIALLEKIEEMVAQNNHQCFEISRSVSPWHEEENIKERANQKLLAVKRRRAELQARIKDEEQHLMDIRIVLLGAEWYSKSSAGNVILGRKVFKTGNSRTTVRCEVGHAKVNGRRLTVVDTPGWHCDHPLEKTSEMDKLEIRQSVYLCPPGPHAILLTVPIDTAFNKLKRTIVKKHMSLLGEKIWNNTIVLFTWGDWLGDTTIEERIETEGEHLQWLIEQCGHRYHVFNCMQDTDNTQVLELLEKIEEMVMENNGHHFLLEMDRNPSTEYELRMEIARTSILKMSKKRDILQKLLKDKECNLSEVRTVLLGTAVEKSMLGNIILQGNHFTMNESNQHNQPSTHTRQCVMKQRLLEGCQVSVVDTPGCSTSTLENAEEILRSVTVCSPGPHAFLLVLSACESFTKKSQQTVKELMSLFGENVWRHTIIVFTNGFWLGDRPVEEHIACEGEDLQQLVGKCGNRYHLIHNDWNNRSQVRNLLKMIEQMVARNRGGYFTLEKNERKPMKTMQSESKPLTEEEWMKREDELIEKMLEVVVVKQDEEKFNSSRVFRRRQQSFDCPIPSMSGESISDSSSLSGHPVNPNLKVSRWLQHSRYSAASSGYDTMSITSSDNLTSVKEMDRNDIPSPPPDHDHILYANIWREHTVTLDSQNL